MPASSKILTPHPPLHPEDTLAGWRGGWGVNILEDARHSSVLYLYRILFAWDYTRGSHRDVVYLGWPIAPSYMSPRRGVGEGCGFLRGCCAHGAQINFEDVTPYLTYGQYLYRPLRNFCRCFYYISHRDIQRLPMTPFSSVLRKEYLDCPQIDSHAVHLKEGGEGSLTLVLSSLATMTSCIDLSVRIVTKSPKVGSLLIFSISLIHWDRYTRATADRENWNWDERC